MSTVTHRDQTVTESPVVEPGVATQRSPRATWQFVQKAGPTAAVLGILAGLAYWGHSTDWTLPKFSALIGSNDAAVEPWCQEHNVPEAVCIECHPALLPPAENYGWCKEHGVAQCPFEHPDVAQVKAVPNITPSDLDRARRALALKPRPENNSRCQLHQRRIQFASLQAVEKAGIDIAVVHERPVVEAVVANGEIGYDQNRMAHLSSRVPGTVWHVEKQVGDPVRKGEVLAIIDAADVGRAKGELLQAIAQFRLQKVNVEQLRPLAGDGSIAGKVLREGETAFEEARIRVQSAQQTLINLGLVVRAEDFADVNTEEIARRIRFLGLPADLVSTLDPSSTTSNLLPLRASLDGLVVERDVVEGEVVDATSVLFTVADLRRLWLTLSVRQEDAKYLSLGQTVLFRQSDASEEPEVQGTIGWISTAADEQTRTVKVRVDLPNGDGRLRANTFGKGRIVLRQEAKAIVVPSEAVHWDGTCNVVFVRDKNYLQPGVAKFFHVRSVRLGVKHDDATEIIAGLLAGEVIASKNSVVLESQLLKSNLGAGCCEVPTPRK